RSSSRPELTLFPYTTLFRSDLERATNPAKTDVSVRSQLGPAIDAGVSRTISNAELADHPLAVWIETRLGLDRPDGTKWVRARPRTLAEAASQLAEDSGRAQDACEEAIKMLLLVAAMPERDRVGRRSEERRVGKEWRSRRARWPWRQEEDGRS